jgi:hypothetical protein
VAEKLHAYVRMYGPTGRPSTRVKDLVDVVLIARHEVFYAAELRRALEETFRAREAHALPVELTSPGCGVARAIPEDVKRGLT